MNNSKYTHPVLSINDIVNAYQKYDTSSEATETIAYFVSALCGISIAKIENMDTLQTPTEFDIAKMITLSTTHITEDTAGRLDNEPDTNALGLTIYKKANYGWFLYISDYVKTDILNDTASLPDDLKLCLKTAIDNNCEWLCLDCDGPEYDKLPKYNW